MNCALKLLYESCDIKGLADRKLSESQKWPLQLWWLNFLAARLEGRQCQSVSPALGFRLEYMVKYRRHCHESRYRCSFPQHDESYQLWWSCLLSSSSTNRSISWLLGKYLKSYWMDLSLQLTIILIVDYFPDWSFSCSVCKMSENVNQ